jgi:hypothetical protein
VDAIVPPVLAAIVPPVVAAVVQPVAKRLARIEALLIEMRFEHDVQTKRINALKDQLEVLTERRLSKSHRARSQNTHAQPRNGGGPHQSR